MNQPEDDGLEVYEQCARDRLEPILGPLRHIDHRGAPPGLHDFEADLTRAVAAIEVTSQVDSKRLGQATSAHQHFGSCRIPGSAFRWDIQLAPNAQANKITHDHLACLLQDMEAHGLRSAHNLDGRGKPFAHRLAEHRIESVYGWQPKDPTRRGTVIVHPGSYGGWGWDAPRTDTWLSALLASSQGQNKLEKLNRARHATELHLVIMLDPASPPGLGIPVGLVDVPESDSSMLPSVIPPAPLTNLWIMPMETSWKGFRWNHNTGWAVLPPAVDPTAPAAKG